MGWGASKTGERDGVDSAGGGWGDDWRVALGVGQDGPEAIEPGTTQWVEVEPGVTVVAGSVAKEGAVAAESLGSAGGDHGDGVRRAAPVGGVGRGGRRSRTVLRWLGVAVVLMVVALVLRGVVGAAVSGQEGSVDPASASALPPLSAAPSTGELVGAPSTPDWWSILEALDQRRSTVLSELDADALGAYAVADSPAWSADAALVEQLTDAGLRPEGLSTTILAVERVDRAEDDSAAGTARGAPVPAPADPSAAAAVDPPLTAPVELVIVDSRSAYALVTEDGEVARRIPAAEARRWRVRLEPLAPAGTPGDPGWRISEVREG